MGVALIVATFACILLAIAALALAYYAASRSMWMPALACLLAGLLALSSLADSMAAIAREYQDAIDEARFSTRKH